MRILRDRVKVVRGSFLIFFSFFFFEKLDLEFIFNLSANVGEVRVFHRVDQINF